MAAVVHSLVVNNTNNETLTSSDACGAPSSGVHTPAFKDSPLSHVNTCRTISHTEIFSPTPNSVSLTTLTCKNSGGYLQPASAHFKQLAASHANSTEGSTAFPLSKASSSGSALWPQMDTDCHWDADRGVLVAPMCIG